MPEKKKWGWGKTIGIGVGIFFAFIIIGSIISYYFVTSAPATSEAVNSEIATEQPAAVQEPTAIPTTPATPAAVPQKTRAATLTIDRVQVQAANLYPTRVTVANTGDVAFSPEFDMIVYDSNGNEVCNGSPTFTNFDIIQPKQKQTEEIEIFACMFTKDGTYTLKVDLLDSEFNKLATASEDFIVDYWNKFS